MASRRIHPLEELSVCVDPAKLTHPVAQQAVVDVTKQLRKLLPGSCWPFPFQIAGIAFAHLAKDRAILGDPMGLGKQMPVYTLVLTPAGWTQIGSIRPGDFVVGSDGRPTLVLSVHPQGVKPSYRVTFSDHSSVEAGPEHLWTVYYKRGGSKEPVFLTLTTEQLISRPVVSRVSRQGHATRVDLSKTTLYLPLLSSPVEFSSPGELPVGPYTLGQIIANAHTVHAVRIAGAVWDWPHVSQRLREEGTDIGNEHQYENVIQASIRGINHHIRQLGLDVLSPVKRIPRKYMQAPPADRLALLQGLMDSDGTVSKENNKVCFCSTSRGLAEDVRELVECLGGIASVREYNRSGENKPTDYQVRIRLPEGCLPFTLPRKAARYQPGNRAHPNRTVTSVEYVRDAPSVCIRVAAEDGLYATEHAILTHNTPQSSCRILLGNHYPAVVICPASMLRTWRKEVTKWLPHAPCCILEKQASPVPGPGWKGVLVVTWSLLEFHLPALLRLRPRILIGDEAHVVLSPDSLRSQAFDALAAATPHLLLATGTPIRNKAHEMHRLLHLVDPAAWPTDTPFREVNKDDFDKGVQSRLYHRIRQYVCRRSKAEALPQLKEKLQEIVPVVLSPDARAEYERIRKQFDLWLAKKLREDVLKALPEATEEEVEEEVARRAATATNARALVQTGVLRRLVGKLKAPYAADWAAAAAGAHESVVVFFEHQEALHIVAGKLKAREVSYGIIDGAASKSRRFRDTEAFQKGTLPVLLCSSAAQEGLTLTKAKHILLAEYDWTAAATDQKIGRLDRIGQERQVTVWRLHAPGTIDDRMAAVINRKRAVESRTVGAADKGLKDRKG